MHSLAPLFSSLRMLNNILSYFVKCNMLSLTRAILASEAQNLKIGCTNQNASNLKYKYASQAQFGSFSFFLLTTMFDKLLKTSSDKTISEKGLDNVIEYTNKASRDIAHLADHNRIASNNFITFGSNQGEDLTVSSIINALG